MGFGQTTNNSTEAVPEKTGSGPVDHIKVGGITVAVWKNKGEHSDFFTYSMQRSYKQGTEWKNTTSLRDGDLPKAILALQKAYEQSFTSAQDDKE